MIETLGKWLPIYTAVVTTGLLATTAALLRTALTSKDATIETLKASIEHWKAQAVKEVHQANEALRKEIAELKRTADNNAERLEREKEAIIRSAESGRAALVAEKTKLEARLDSLSKQLKAKNDPESAARVDDLKITMDSALKLAFAKPNAEIQAALLAIQERNKELADSLGRIGLGIKLDFPNISQAFPLDVKDLLKKSLTQGGHQKEKD